MYFAYKLNGYILKNGLGCFYYLIMCFLCKKYLCDGILNGFQGFFMIDI